jgi:hypothetical protein
MQVSSTTDAVSGVNNGALYIAGGATIAKNLSALSISTGNIMTSSITTSNVVASTITSANLSVGTLTAGNLRVPGTLTVTNITVNNLVQSSGSIIATSNSNTIGTLIMNSAGNVGLGTTAPTYALNVNGNIKSQRPVRIHHAKY